MEDDKDPLDWLPEKEARVTDALLVVIESSISDPELKGALIGAILCEIDEWGKSKPH
jgi:hypothetical protein